tara:strand:- start:1792 stop:2781 length:990 start_codon:yes stop_codon:yes gene_type:complete
MEFFMKLLSAVVVLLSMLAAPQSADAALSCPAGQQAVAADTCGPCPKGTFKKTSGTGNCAPANAGYHVPETGMTKQIGCPGGTYSSSPGGVSCVKCGAGMYSARLKAPTSQVCQTAGRGYYAAKSGSVSQTPASAGYYVSGLGQMRQTACPAGTYNPKTKQTSKNACITVGAGYYADGARSDGTAATKQTACPAGTFSAQNKARSVTACKTVPAGYYADGAAPNGTAATRQTACPAGTYNPKTKQTSRNACITAAAGYYAAAAGSASQTRCAANYQSAAGSTGCTVTLYNSPGDYYNHWGRKAAPGTKGKSPHKCKDGKNWKKSAQACK